MNRRDGRPAEALRPVTLQRDFARNSPGSVLYRCGGTTLLVTAHLSESVPPFLEGKGTGWLTAEYGMLPGSTPSRKDRRTDGRATEIQRLIGRSLRAAVDLAAIGPRTLHIDADVIEADGGTRCAAITAGYVAAVDALRRKLGADVAAAALREPVAAISVGIVGGLALLDLDYSEDVGAEVDMNVVRRGPGGFIEIQGTAEGAPFSRDQLDALLAMATAGLDRLQAIQAEALAEPPTIL